MKNLFTICLFVLISFSSITAQEAEKSQNFNHEFGLDVTDLMRQFLFSNNTFFPIPTSVTESYTLSYRLMYKDKINLRVGLGGNFNNGEQTVDTVRSDVNFTSIRYRIGIDRIQPISKRWEAYYGIDFFQNRNETLNQFISVNNNYIRTMTQSQNRYGIAPLVGVRFRFNDRVGLQTSLNAEFYQNTDTFDTEYKVFDPNIAAVLPLNQTTGSSLNGLDINIPINLVLTFRL